MLYYIRIFSIKNYNICYVLYVLYIYNKWVKAIEHITNYCETFRRKNIYNIVHTYMCIYEYIYIYIYIYIYNKQGNKTENNNVL